MISQIRPIPATQFIHEVKEELLGVAKKNALVISFSEPKNAVASQQALGIQVRQKGLMHAFNVSSSLTLTVEQVGIEGLWKNAPAVTLWNDQQKVCHQCLESVESTVKMIRDLIVPK